MILIDVNVLIYAHRADSVNHTSYKEWLEDLLNSQQPFGISELVLSGCLRILTHPKIFNPPTLGDTAIAFVNQLRDHPHTTIIQPGASHWDIFIDLCKHSDAKGNLISDAYHAALAIESGCEWITTDRDFARFPGLQWRHPFE